MAERKDERWIGGQAAPCEALQAAGAAFAAQVQADADRAREAAARMLSGLVAAESSNPDLRAAGLGVLAGAAVELVGTAATVPCPACGERVREETWDDEDCDGRGVARCSCGMVRLDGQWYAPVKGIDRE